MRGYEIKNGAYWLCNEEWKGRTLNSERIQNLLSMCG